MAKKKTSEASKSPVSSHDQANSAHKDNNCQIKHAQASTNRASYDLLPGSNFEIGQGMNARTLYHQNTSAVIGAPREPQDSATLRGMSHVRRQRPVDDEPSSRAKMWDPVKDCNDPNTMQADFPDLLSARHDSNEELIDSTISGVASMDLHFRQGDIPYGQAQDNRQRSMDAGTTVASSMGQPLYPQSHAMVPGYQGYAPMGSQRSQVDHPYDQFRCSLQRQSGYGNASILPPHPRESPGRNGQQPLESMIRGAVSLSNEPCRGDSLNGHPREFRQHPMRIESRMPSSMASHDEADPQPTSPQTPMNLSTPREPEPKHANRLQRQSSPTHTSKALSIAHYAESLERQSNFTEAVRAYKQACAFLQDVIVQSCNPDERKECNQVKNAYEACLDVLSRESAPESQVNSPSEEDGQQDDDGTVRGKPQYSLLEDWALFQKEAEDLSWQEVAEKPIFKGKRKHRSLSQRKHTIGKMGPKYHEAEKPWTEEENKKLRALGDAGKTLGDIHRKFRSRHAENCLQRYFQLKGYDSAGRSHTRTTHQAHQEPAQCPRSTQHTHSSSVVARHRGSHLHSSTSVIDTCSRRPRIYSGLQQVREHRQFAFGRDQNIPAVFPLRHQTHVRSPTHPHVNGAEAPTYSTAPISSNNAGYTEQFIQRNQGSTEPLRLPRLVTAPMFSPSSQTGAEGPEHHTPSVSAQVVLPNARGALTGNGIYNRSFTELFSNESFDRVSNSGRRRPAQSSSSNSTSPTSNTWTNPSTPSASPTSYQTDSPAPETQDSRDSHNAAAHGVRKSRRAAPPDGA